MRLCVATMAMVCAFSVAAQAAPILGHYESGSLGGPVLDGRFTFGLDAWPAATDGELAGASYNGGLGGQWTLTGATVFDLDIDTLAPGLTQWDVIYDPGAVLTLMDGGPWDGDAGAVDYTVTLTSLEQSIFIWTDGLGNVTNTVSSLTFEGDFGGGYELVDGTASAVFRDFGTVPPGDYPAMPGSFSEAGWGILNNIQFDVTPEPATLALMGLGLAGALGARRRR